MGKKTTLILLALMVLVCTVPCFASPVLGATIEEMFNNSLLVGSDIYLLADTESYTMENVLASMQCYREEYPGRPVPLYFKWKGYWFDLSRDFSQLSELNEENAILIEDLITREYGIFYGKGLECEPIDPVRSTYRFAFEQPGTVLSGEETCISMGLETLREGAAGCDGVLFFFETEVPREGAEVNFSAVDSAGNLYSAVNSGTWGPEGGFNLPAKYSAATEWKVIFSNAGTYRITFRLVHLSDESTLAEGSAVIAVDPVKYSSYAIAWEGPEELTYGETGLFQLKVTGDGTGNRDCPAIFDYALTGGDGLLEYRESGFWHPLPPAGVLGFPGGFEMPSHGDFTVDLRFTPSEAGSCNFDTVLRTAGTDHETIAIMEEQFAVNRRPLGIIAGAGEKTYGEEDPELTCTVLGLVFGDEISGTLERSDGEDAGTYAIDQGTLTAGENYVIEYTGADFVINRAALTITADSFDKIYGEQYLFAGIEFMVSGLIGSDAVAAVILSSDGAAADAAAGAYEIAAAGAVGAGLNNYEIKYLQGRLTVIKAVPNVPVWPEASAIHEGDLLSASVLSGGIAGVAGTFVFDEPGLKPTEGVCCAAVTFRPDDAANYCTVSGTVNVTVNPARALIITAFSGYVNITSNYGIVLPKGSASAIIADGHNWYNIGDILEVRVITPFPRRMSSLILEPRQYSNDMAIISGYGSGQVQETTLLVEVRDREHPAAAGQFTVLVWRDDWSTGLLKIGPITVLPR